MTSFLDGSLNFPGNAGRAKLEQLSPRDTEHNAGLVWGLGMGNLVSSQWQKFPTCHSHTLPQFSFRAGAQGCCSSCVLQAVSLLQHSILQNQQCSQVSNSDQKTPCKSMYKINTCAVFTKCTYSRFSFLLHCLILY